MKKIFGSKPEEKIVELKQMVKKLESSPPLMLNKIQELKDLIQEIEIISERDNIEILEIKYNLKSDSKLLVYKLNNKFDVMVREPLTASENSILRYNTKILVRHREYDNEFYIDDIPPNSNQSLGFGSLAMENLIKIAEQIKIKCITGRMNYKDLNHRLKLEKYYTKHGFEISGITINLNINE